MCNSRFQACIVACHLSLTMFGGGLYFGSSCSSKRACKRWRCAVFPSTALAALWESMQLHQFVCLEWEAVRTGL